MFLVVFVVVVVVVELFDAYEPRKKMLSYKRGFPLNDNELSERKSFFSFSPSFFCLPNEESCSFSPRVWDVASGGRNAFWFPNYRAFQKLICRGWKGKEKVCRLGARRLWLKNKPREKNPFRTSSKAFLYFLLCSSCFSLFFISIRELWLFIYIIMSYHRAHRKQIRITFLLLIAPFLLRLANKKKILNGFYFFCFVTISGEHFLSSSFSFLSRFFLSCLGCCRLPISLRMKSLVFNKDRVNVGFIISYKNS